jgi:hypothetical protein
MNRHWFTRRVRRHLAVVTGIVALAGCGSEDPAPSKKAAPTRTSGPAVPNELVRTWPAQLPPVEGAELPGRELATCVLGEAAGAAPRSISA